MMSHWFNTYQKVDGQKPAIATLSFFVWFNTYQKVDGQKHGLYIKNIVTGFNTYQKVDGQKPSISNIETAGDNDEWLSIND